MYRWEYMAVPVFADASPSEMEKFNQLGSQGWELAGFTMRSGTTVYAIFKRPLQEASEKVELADAGPPIMPW